MQNHFLHHLQLLNFFQEVFQFVKIIKGQGDYAYLFEFFNSHSFINMIFWSEMMQN